MPDRLAREQLVEADGDEARGFAAAGLQARADLIEMRPVRDAVATVALSTGAGGAVVAFLVASWRRGVSVWDPGHRRRSSAPSTTSVPSSPYFP